MQKFSDRMQQLNNEAMTVVQELITANNGIFVAYEGGTAYHEASDKFDPEFLNRTIELEICTQRDPHDDVYLLGFEDDYLDFVDKFGNEDSIHITELEEHTVSEVADWIIAKNLVEIPKWHTKVLVHGDGDLISDLKGMLQHYHVEFKALETCLTQEDVLRRNEMYGSLQVTEYVLGRLGITAEEITELTNEVLK